MNSTLRRTRSVTCVFCKEYGHTCRYCNDPTVEPTIARCHEIAKQNVQNAGNFMQELLKEDSSTIVLFGSRRFILEPLHKTQIILKLFKLYQYNFIVRPTPLAPPDGVMYPLPISPVSMRDNYDMDIAFIPLLFDPVSIEKWIKIEESSATSPIIFDVKECSVCYEEITKVNYRRTNCNHIYCGVCINKWKNIQKNNLHFTCPMCVSPVLEIHYYEK